MELKVISDRVMKTLRTQRIEPRMVRDCETKGGVLTITWGRINPHKDTPDQVLVLPFESEEAANYARAVVRHGTADLGPDPAPSRDPYKNGPSFLAQGPVYE